MLVTRTTPRNDVNIRSSMFTTKTWQFISFVNQYEISCHYGRLSVIMYQIILSVQKNLTA